MSKLLIELKDAEVQPQEIDDLTYFILGMIAISKKMLWHLDPLLASESEEQHNGLSHNDVYAYPETLQQSKRNRGLVLR
jgi:hypothetical protein